MLCILQSTTYSFTSNRSKYSSHICIHDVWCIDSSIGTFACSLGYQLAQRRAVWDRSQTCFLPIEMYGIPLLDHVFFSIFWSTEPLKVLHAFQGRPHCWWRRFFQAMQAFELEREGGAEIKINSMGLADVWRHDRTIKASRYFFPVVHIWSHLRIFPCFVSTLSFTVNRLFDSTSGTSTRSLRPKQVNRGQDGQVVLFVQMFFVFLRLGAFKVIFYVYSVHY